MFCPQCKSEYRSGFIVCNDCNVNLVDTLPSENTEKEQYVQYVDVLHTFNPADISYIKSILDCEGIIYYFKGEHFSRIDPMIEPARLMVEESQVDRVKELLRDSDLSFMTIDLYGTKQKIHKDTHSEMVTRKASVNRINSFITSIFIGYVILYVAVAIVSVISAMAFSSEHTLWGWICLVLVSGIILLRWVFRHLKNI